MSPVTLMTLSSTLSMKSGETEHSVKFQTSLEDIKPWMTTNFQTRTKLRSFVFGPKLLKKT